MEDIAYRAVLHIASLVIRLHATDDDEILANCMACVAKHSTWSGVDLYPLECRYRENPPAWLAR